MNEMIVIQNVSNMNSLPAKKLLIEWASKALGEDHQGAEITIRIVDELEGQSLNKKWRKKKSATNVLSFPVGKTLKQVPKFLGDIVICAPVVEREAYEQDKTFDAHWAHLIIHAVLHLQGYDHDSNKRAEVMESKEIKILKNIGYTNPYEQK